MRPLLLILLFAGMVWADLNFTEHRYIAALDRTSSLEGVVRFHNQTIEVLYTNGRRLLKSGQQIDGYEPGTSSARDLSDNPQARLMMRLIALSQSFDLEGFWEDFAIHTGTDGYYLEPKGRLGSKLAHITLRLDASQAIETILIDMQNGDEIVIELTKPGG